MCFEPNNLLVECNIAQVSWEYTTGTDEDNVAAYYVIMNILTDVFTPRYTGASVSLFRHDSSFLFLRYLSG